MRIATQERNMYAVLTIEYKVIPCLQTDKYEG